MFAVASFHKSSGQSFKT